MSPGTAGAVTFIAEGAVALVAIGQVVASGPVVAGPGRALVDVQLTVWTLESWHTVAAEVIKRRGGMADWHSPGALGARSCSQHSL